MIRNRPVSLALVGLFLWLTGCTSYRQVGPVEVADYGKARVTLADGSQFVVAHPQIQADSLVGFVAESWSAKRKAYSEDVRVALDQIETLEASHTSASKTAGLVVGLFVGVLLIGSLIYAATDPCYVFCD